MSISADNVQDPDLLPFEAKALELMIAKREYYVEQGRAKEAHGLGTGIMILWNTLKGNPIPNQTNWSKL